MERINTERRKSTLPPAYPLIDSSGCQVESDRRSGRDRRKNKRGLDVAGKILNILN